MAYKVLHLAAERDDLLKKRELLRSDRVELYRKRNSLKDEINALTEDTSKEEKDELESKIDDLVSKIKKIEEEIGIVEEMICGKEDEIEEVEKSQRAILGMNRTIQKRETEKGGMFGNMKSIVLRSGESMLDRKNYSNEEKNLDLGKYIRGMVTGKWENAEMEKRELTTAGTSPLIPGPLMLNIFDKARNLSLFASANVPVIQMETNNLTIVRVNKDLAPYFKKEGELGVESNQMELEGVQLVSKTIYGYAYVSLEAIDSAENLEIVIRDSFAKGLAEAMDQAMLYGVYENGEYKEYAPSGILNDPRINKINAVNSDYDDIIKAIGKVKSNNGEAKVLAMNSVTEEDLSILKDKNGQYIIPPESYNSVKKIVTNQLSYSEENGSDLIVFDPNALAIGLQEYMSLKVFDSDTVCIQRGMVCFRIMAMIDCVVLSPESICHISGFGKTNA